MKKILSGILDFTEFVPLGWVLTCIDLGVDWIIELPVEGLLTLAAATFIAGILSTFGSFVAAGGNWGNSMPTGQDLPIGERIRNLLIMLAVLAFITYAIRLAMPS
jgi:hypothetical protein